MVRYEYDFVPVRGWSAWWTVRMNRYVKQPDLALNP